jgi:hypothetical protein
LEKRICKDHVLRKIAAVIDFDIIYKRVEYRYGSKDNGSGPAGVKAVVTRCISIFLIYVDKKPMASMWIFAAKVTY